MGGGGGDNLRIAPENLLMFRVVLLKSAFWLTNLCVFGSFITVAVNRAKDFFFFFL